MECGFRICTRLCVVREETAFGLPGVTHERFCLRLRPVRTCTGLVDDDDVVDSVSELSEQQLFELVFGGKGVVHGRDDSCLRQLTMLGMRFFRIGSAVSMWYDAGPVLGSFRLMREPKFSLFFSFATRLRVHTYL
jgi:hypothetical protein